MGVEPIRSRVQGVSVPRYIPQGAGSFPRKSLHGMEALLPKASKGQLERGAGSEDRTLHDLPCKRSGVASYAHPASPRLD